MIAPMKMKMKIKFALGILTTTLSLNAFAQTGAQPEQCTYSLDPNSVSVGFTAYKTTQKVGVNGTFKKTHVHGKLSAPELAALLQGIHVMVDFTSVDTNNPVRNQTVIDYFFSKLKPSVSGRIKSFSEKDKTFVLDLNFNGHHNDVPMTYASDANQNFQATGSINLSDFGGDDALASIHQKCYELHKGPDGVSKTWPDVTLNLKGAIAKSCQ